MKAYKGYLIDLDGTMYRGTEVIEEAAEFVKRLIAAQIPYLYVTNNSTKTPEQVAKKLQEFQIPAKASEVFTSAMASANYIVEKSPGANVFMIGEKGLQHALEEKDLKLMKDSENVDYVVAGLDQQITYEKLTVACLAVRNGAQFVITNGDTALPSERGLLPGNGALTSVISVSTQQQPVVVGKPESIIVDQAIKLLDLPKEDVLMVGDNYQTDIMAGINAKMDTLLVYTGVTTKEQLSGYSVKPTYTVDSLSEWAIIK
ncbi:MULTISPECIES: TIGR01457 family HAD-type hydrolase [Niallia]|jgi:4-nitrophenyl phosphatase|uniref:Acid sugar phosphatase n=1 Tax=Niallia circulans TaxID=1397 RepID=A0A0J1IK09_NIACI|nr:TIGR01457 family HAD-type hydrolase [Niallia circulans]KLV26306.1 HAD family hydrolase [Niallia circulans]MCM2982224.1 TIGR01457 family HAD-type hydrolase [Niallia circulans]MED5101589.1 TIGR01457 family HAD-type hydrolase [Niallia circulans]